MTKKAALAIIVIVFGGLFALLAAAADQPLSADDVTLLLLGGSPSPKIITLVKQRGVSFRMNADLAKKFHDSGASDDLIDALTDAGRKPQGSSSSSGPAVPEPGATPSQQSQSGSGTVPPPATSAPAATTSSHTSNPAEVDRKVEDTLSGLESDSEGNGRPYAARFSLVSITGQKLDLADYKGKVVLLNFWASWCPHCRAMIPELVGLHDQYYSKGLRIVGIAVGDRKQAVEAFYQNGNINYPIAIGDANTRRLYGGVSGLPTTVLVGRDGRVYSRFEGEPRDIGTLEGTITRLLARPAGNPEAGQQTVAPATPPGGQASPPAAVVVGASSPVPAAASEGAPEGAAGSSSQQPASPNAPAANSQTANVNQKVAETLNKLTAPEATTAKPVAAKATADLTDPSPDQIQKIIQEFAAKEKLFKEARDNYTYHQINKVEELGPDNDIEGVYEQEWDILFDDSGKRIERVTYAPADTLKKIIMTEEDLTSFRNTQPFVLTTDELPEYEIKYLGHVKVDEITAFVFQVRPKEIQKGRQYFQGVVWVDDQDLQIVKSEGKPVPELHTRKGENLFPRFTTYREQIDGKYWFPTYTMADDTLYFSSGSVHIKEILRYTDYKQFKSKVRIVSATPTDQPSTTTTPATPQQ